jgi:hypothetical protein
MRDTNTIEGRTADSLAWKHALYRLTSPPPGVDPDVVDKLWDPVENELRGLVSRLDAAKLEKKDPASLYAYLAAMVVRHPSFKDQVDAIYSQAGAIPPSGNALQLTRWQALIRAQTQVLDWRWRVLHSPAGTQRFLINDRGWT